MEDVKKVQPSSSGHQYEVFLSFRGPDTRAGITDFLYTSLRDAGVYVYRDDEELRVGEEIGPELLEAINQSKIAIPVLSRNYASSKWCLKELAQMVNCRKTKGQKIMPIFYDVTPTVVRHQTGNYANAFLAYEKEKRYSEEAMQEWRASLLDVGTLKGWDLQKSTERREGEFVKIVVKKVLNELRKAYLLVTDTLVGMDYHVQKIMDNVKGTTDDTRFIGIHGMGGVGKTTLAKIIYNQLSHMFEECCFLANVREVSRVKGIEFLQNQLISTISRKMLPKISNSDEGVMIIKERLSSKKVLILVDDVNHEEQLRKLVGGRSWFGLGSMIIVTTRNKSILRSIRTCWTYEIPCLEFLQSMKLFSIHAFRNDYPPSDFAALSENVVKMAGGLPLALQVIGSNLCGKDKRTWNRVLRKLRDIPHQDVRNKLRISYDMLEPEQKQIFLDIACFFIGKNRDLVLYMWEDCYPNAELCLEELEQMSLIKINKNNNLWMHDQLKDLGRNIVQQESPFSMQKSRLWNPKKTADILLTLQGTETIEAIFVKFEDVEQLASSFRGLINLRYLRFLHVSTNHAHRINNSDGSRNILPSDNMQSGVNTLPNLRWLSWHHLKVELLMLVTLSLRNLVILDLSETDVHENWLGWQKLKSAKKLKVLDLSRCTCLKVTPDLSGIMSLERLILQGCENLVDLHCSLGQLKSLVSLTLEYCKNLCLLPEDMSGLTKLRELLMNNSGIQRISDAQASNVSKTLRADSFCLTSVGYLIYLSNLDLSDTPITQLSASIRGMARLEVLNLRDCALLTGLPDEIGDLASLVVLDVTRSGVKELPNTIGKLKALTKLLASFSKLEKLPISIGKLQNLEELNVSCSSLQGKVPSGIKRLSSLRILRLSSTSISVLPTLPSNLTVFCFGSRVLRVIPDLSNLTNLRHLELMLLGNNELKFELVQSPSPLWIGKLQKLESLVLSLPNITTLSPEIGNLTLLRDLCLYMCKNLQEINRLPPSLSSLLVSFCPSLTSFPDVSYLQSLSGLFIGVCRITEINGLEKLRGLSCLIIIRCLNLRRLPDLSELNNLRVMLMSDCPRIVEIRGRLDRLEALTLLNCSSLERISTEHFTSLEKFHLVCCPKVNGLEDVREFCYNGQKGKNDTGTLKDILVTADKNARDLYLKGSLTDIWSSVTTGNRRYNFRI